MRPHRSSEPEVGELDGGVVLVAHKEKVLRLEVAVGHVYVVAVLDRVEQHHQHVSVSKYNKCFVSCLEKKKEKQRWGRGCQGCAG